MELFQVFWDDRRNLFLEFKKNEEDKLYFVLENIKRLNLKYQLSRVDRKDAYNKEMPILVSIKNFLISEDFMAFSIDLDLLMPQEDLEIKFVNLTVFFYSGEKIEVSINEVYEISDICINEEFDTLNFQNRLETEERASFITQERVYQEVSKDFQNNREKTTSVYEKNQIKNPSNVLPYISTIHENSERLRNMELYLKDISETLKHMKFNGVGFGSPGLSSQEGMSIKRITRVPVKNLTSTARLSFLPELKEVFSSSIENNGNFNFREILKPMEEDELKMIVLDDEVLEKKELEAISRQLEKSEKVNSSQRKLEDLKKPPTAPKGIKQKNNNNI